MEIITNLSELGRVFQQVSDTDQQDPDPTPGSWVQRLKDGISKASIENPWFTVDNTLAAIGNWAGLLRKDPLQQWLKAYPKPQGPPKRVALVLAGNIPLVGFHDLLAVWVTGNIALVKFASKDRILMPLIVEFMTAINPAMATRTIAVAGTLSEYDAVIATGSNNTGRYFRHYFRDKPHIIRHNRTSIAVLDGKETPGQLRGLARDVFLYFGLGCRNVSKLFVPEHFDITALATHWDEFKTLTDHHKYANNYHYHKSVWLMNGEEFIDTGYVLLKEDQALFAPLGTVYFERYGDMDALTDRIAENARDIQAIVSHLEIPGAIPFGHAQNPGLDDYADGVDTVDFLLKT